MHRHAPSASGNFVAFIGFINSITPFCSSLQHHPLETPKQPPHPFRRSRPLKNFIRNNLTPNLR